MKKLLTSSLLVLAAVISMSAQTDPDHMYILGNVGDQDWDPSVGTEMQKVDDYSFEIIAHFNASSYFSFTSELAETSNDWDAIMPYRLAAPSNNYEITENLFGQPIQLNDWGVNVNNAFLITGAADYKIEIYTDELLVVITPQGEIEQEVVEPDGNIYILGDINGHSWAPNSGVMMTKESDNIYTSYLFTTADSCTFDFSRALAKTPNNWAGIAPYRFGAVENGTEVELDLTMPLGEEGNDNSFKICDAGNYFVTIDLEARTMTVTAAEVEEAMYIVGNDPFGGWEPAAGVKMTKNGDVYTYEATLTGDTWFIFTDAPGDWGFVNNGHRYGPLGENEDVVADVPVQTQLSDNGNASYKAGAGEYVITFDKENLTFTFATKGAGVRGDLNGDGIVDVSDVNMMIDIVLGKYESLLVKDLNGDGKIDVNDANIIVGLADLIGDGNVDVTDVNALIDIVLGK